MGCDYIGIGMMPPKSPAPSGCGTLPMTTKEAAKKIAAAGADVPQPQHRVPKFDGKLVIDTLLESFAPRRAGLYLGHLLGADGRRRRLRWIEKPADRIPLRPLKGHGRQRAGRAHHGAGGRGQPALGEILATLEKCGKNQVSAGGAGRLPESPFTCLEKSYKYLNSLGYKNRRRAKRESHGGSTAAKRIKSASLFKRLQRRGQRLRP